MTATAMTTTKADGLTSDNIMIKRPYSDDYVDIDIDSGKSMDMDKFKLSSFDL